MLAQNKQNEEFMDFFLKIFENHILIASTFSWLICQLLKFILTAIVEKKWRFERLVGDGGMPSGHSATVSAMMVMTGYCCGLASAPFAIATLLAIIVMHDATGVRREAGKHAVTILQIIDAFNEVVSEKDKLAQQEKLKVFVGHTPVQVFFGAVTGILTSVIYILVFHVAGILPI